MGVVSIDSLKAALSQAQGIEAALIDDPLVVDAQTPLSELLSHVGQAPCAVRLSMKNTSMLALFQTYVATGFRSRGGNNG
ncbi:glycine betaine/L-proline transport ATP-binding protein [Salmonella enterica subsp. enterica]|uniref:Glycine betaine/L-proline transport ATP-binding protein n=1 Tax=Salmonella enterica I TaxID=59201 RepID=A0A379WNE9_SALET|nr:glycine betaine/L-proline transport ATP-binding protein [Salmonella enterica subsp. enterica]